MKSFFHITIFLVTFSVITFSQQEDKLIRNLPSSVEGVYAGITTLSFFNYDDASNSWLEHTSKVQVALQTKFESPIGELKFKGAYELINNTTVVNIFIHNQWKNFKLDIGYKALPVTSLNRNFPFTAGGQFEYESQKVIAGSAPSINVEYSPYKTLSLYYGFGQRATVDKKFIPEQHLGIKFKAGEVTTKLAVSQNSSTTQMALTLEGFSVIAMAGYSKNKAEKYFSYVNWSISSALGDIYIDYVRENGRDSYLEFGQYWTKQIYKDVVMHIGYGFAPVSKFFYVYSFIHI